MTGSPCGRRISLVSEALPTICKEIGILFHGKDCHPVRGLICRLMRRIDLSDKICHGSASWDDQETITIICEDAKGYYQIPGYRHEAAAQLEHIKRHKGYVILPRILVSFVFVSVVREAFRRYQMDVSQSS